jgi:hypothetical protein
MTTNIKTIKTTHIAKEFGMTTTSVAKLLKKLGVKPYRITYVGTKKYIDWPVEAVTAIEDHRVAKHEAYIDAAALASAAITTAQAPAQAQPEFVEEAAGASSVPASGELAAIKAQLAEVLAMVKVLVFELTGSTSLVPADD